MEVPVIATVVGTGIANVGVGVTIIVLLIRGSDALGRSTAQVEILSAAVTEVRNEVVGAIRTEVGETRAEARQDKEELRAEIREARAEAREDNRQLRADMVAGFETLANAIDAFRAEVQQTNQMVAALANHTPDTDGRTVFTVPSPPNR